MECQNNNSCGAGKGDRPRNCFSEKFKKNYDFIKWNGTLKNKTSIEKKHKQKFFYK